MRDTEYTIQQCLCIFEACVQKSNLVYIMVGQENLYTKQKNEVLERRESFRRVASQMRDWKIEKYGSSSMSSCTYSSTNTSIAGFSVILAYVAVDNVLLLKFCCCSFLDYDCSCCCLLSSQAHTVKIHTNCKMGFQIVMMLIKYKCGKFKLDPGTHFPESNFFVEF